MNNVTLGLVLLPGTDPIQTTVTDINGYYQFTNLCPGFYTIVVLNNNKVVNGEGINSTDAAQVNYWPVSIPSDSNPTCRIQGSLQEMYPTIIT